MGIVKSAMLEAEDRGYDVDHELRVCTECFEDGALIQFITENASEGTCSFCNGSEGQESCELFDVLGMILAGISTEWGHPSNEGLGYETREGGWQGDVYDTWDMLESVGLEVATEKLFQTIVQSILNAEWCRRNPYSLEQHQMLLVGWRSFSKFVTNEARYVFLQATPNDYDPNQHDEIQPVAILEYLGSMANDLQLIYTLPQGQEILRVRIVEPDKVLSTAAELGPPPIEHATIPNRMSPAGIPMFYGAFDQQTAIAETYDVGRGSMKKGVVGKFQVRRDFLLLDLSRHIGLPSLFDFESVQFRYLVKFIDGFVTDFSKPISRDDRSHIDYVPTQVVTEYFRHIFRTPDGEQLDGIIYPSSKNEGHQAVVLFVGNSQCVDLAAEHTDEALLTLMGIEEVALESQI